MPEASRTASSEVLTREESDASVAFSAEQEIKQTIKRMKADWIVLAQQLYEFVEAEHWRALGYDSIGEWMASPEIDLEYRQMYVYMEIYRDLVIAKKVKPERLGELQVSRVREVVGAVRKGLVPVKEALNDAESLGRQDLREKYAGATVIDRPFNAKSEPKWHICQACGSRVRSRGEDE